MVEQVEITPNGKMFLSLDNPNEKGSMFYDQSLNELGLEEEDFITQEEFDEIWNSK